jgi:fibronectin type 3 domain-containing protein
VKNVGGSMIGPARWRRIGRAVCALALAGTLSGCTAILDFERARRYLDRPRAPSLPTLREDLPTANLHPPEGLRAVSGELRRVPLKWDPLLTGEVGGYVVERAATREGPFERLAPIAGALATTYIDHITSAQPAPHDAGDDVASAPPPDASATRDGDLGAETEAAQAATTEIAAGEPVANGPDGATYFYRVRAFTPSGRLATLPSEVVGAATAAAPAAPQHLRAYSQQPRKVPLSWSASADPTVAGYRVERSPTSLGPFQPVARIDGRHTTTHVDQGLGDLRVFYYRVAALNAAGGEGTPSDAVRAVTKPEPLPPIGLRIVERHLGSNRLAWEPNVEPDVEQYRVLRLREGAAEPEVVTTVQGSALEARDTEVGAGETVTYALTAFDRDGLESAPSDPVAVRSEGYDLRASALADGVHLEWNPRADEGYREARVFRRTRLNRREFPPVAGSAFVDADVKPGRSYRYSVTLISEDGAPAPRSAPIEVQIPPE